MSEFSIEITSVPDRESLVAEIWYKMNLVAEVNQENDKLEIEFYPTEKLSFDFHDFLETLEIIKNKI